MDLTLLMHFFMCMTVINIIIYFINLILIKRYKKTFLGLHVRLLKLDKKQEDDIDILALIMLKRYKIFIIFFNIAPLIALYLMTL